LADSLLLYITIPYYYSLFVWEHYKQFQVILWLDMNWEPIAACDHILNGLVCTASHLLLLLLLLLQASNFCSGMQCKPNRRNKTATYWLEVETPRDYNINGELTCLRPKDFAGTCKILQDPARLNMLSDGYTGTRDAHLLATLQVLQVILLMSPGPH
jgi:hypothetical protein